MRLRIRYLLTALPLAGSALLLFSCDKEAATESIGQQVQMTEYSENLSVVTSENGRKSYHFTAPLMEGYSLAREPYREFRKGVRIVTYTENDSLSTVDATLTANYAIYYEKRELWEAKGNVVIVKGDGKRLYTQQLFWNATTKRIYSNVDTRIVDGVDNFIGEGFESDDELRKWKFRRMKGRMTVEMTPPSEPADQIPLAPTPLEEEERAGRLTPLGQQPASGPPAPVAPDGDAGASAAALQHPQAEVALPAGASDAAPTILQGASAAATARSDSDRNASDRTIPEHAVEEPTGNPAAVRMDSAALPTVIQGAAAITANGNAAPVASASAAQTESSGSATDADRVVTQAIASGER